jgi:general secretion pathway protein I
MMNPGGWRRKAEGDVQALSKDRSLKGPERAQVGEVDASSPHPLPLTSHGFKGFTLLEVMVAVAILALVLVSLLGVKNRSTVNVMLADHITTATLLAKRVMTDTLASGQLTEMEDQGGFEEDEFKDYAWQKTVAPVPIEQVKIMEVRVAVLWKEGERQEQVELVSYE